jgi:hypothetical protein
VNPLGLRPARRARRVVPVCAGTAAGGTASGLVTGVYLCMSVTLCVRQRARFGECARAPATQCGRPCATQVGCACLRAPTHTPASLTLNFRLRGCFGRAPSSMRWRAAVAMPPLSFRRALSKDVHSGVRAGAGSSCGDTRSKCAVVGRVAVSFCNSHSWELACDAKV